MIIDLYDNFFFLLYLKKLYSNAGKHELEQRGDDDDVADGPDGNKHALHHVLETHITMTVSVWVCVCLPCVCVIWLLVWVS